MTVPEWLEDLLEKTPRHEVLNQEGEVAVGDTRIAQPMDGPQLGEQRPVLVLELSEPPMFAHIALTTPELDLAGGRDVLLDGSHDDLPYRLLVELDVLGPVFIDQLGPVIARVDPTFTETLRNGPARELDGIPAQLIGLPVTRRSDPRWEFKTREIDALHALSREAFAELLDGAPTVVDPSLWNRLLSERGPGSARRRRLAGELFACGPLSPVSPKLAAALTSQCEGLSARLGRDASRVITRYLARSLHTPARVGAGAAEALREQGLPDALAHELREVAERRAATLLIAPGTNFTGHMRVRGPNGNMQITTLTLEDE